MKRCILLLILLLAGTAELLCQDVFAGSRGRWMEIAAQTTPELTVTEVSPVSVVEAMAAMVILDNYLINKTTHL